MKVSITTISVATVLFLMAGQASGSGEITCLEIAQGICIKMQQGPQGKCVIKKNKQCLKNGYKWNENESSVRITQGFGSDANCYERYETVSHCIYLYGPDNPCVMFDMVGPVTYCLM